MDGRTLRKDIEILRKQGIPEDIIEAYRRISDGSNGNPSQRELEIFEHTTNLMMLLGVRK